MKTSIKLLLAGSLLLNLAVAAGYAQFRRSDAPPPEPELIARLQLDAAQQRALQELRQALRARALELRAQSQPTQRELLAELRREPADRQRVRALLESHGAARSALQVEIVMALLDYRARLAAPQRAAFDAALAEPAFLRRMAGFAPPAP